MKTCWREGERGDREGERNLREREKEGGGRVASFPGSPPPLY